MDIKVCDVCRNRNRDAFEKSRVIGFENDPSGERVEKVASVNLCNPCYIKALESVLESTPLENKIEGNIKFFEEVNEMKSEIKNG